MTNFVDVPVFKGCLATVQVAIPEPLRVLDGVVPPPNHGVFQILNPNDGDKRVVWDSGSLAEIQAAKKMFDDLVAEGLEPYRVGVGGKATAKKMEEFDPMAEQVIFLPGKKLAVGG
jgi:methylmalonyl-CoA mutase cobalamin-binding subunit